MMPNQPRSPRDRFWFRFCALIAALAFVNGAVFAANGLGIGAFVNLGAATYAAARAMDHYRRWKGP